MSNPIKTSVFLPSYILQCVRNDSNPPKIDPEIFLSKASCSNISDIILAFYPHFIFDKNAKDNNDFLRKIFEDMVAARLYNLVIPSNLKPQNYVQISLRDPICRSQPSRTVINSADDINPRRIAMFSSCALPYLRSGQDRLAAKNLNKFVKTFNYLTEEEIHEIQSVQEEAEETLRIHVLILQDAHQSIEAIYLQLCDPDISADRRQDIEVELKAATRSLELRQKMFNSAIQDVGFLAALKRHHLGKCAAHIWSLPAEDTAEVPNEGATPKTDDPMDKST